METRQFRFVNPKSGDGVKDWVDSEFLGVFWGVGRGEGDDVENACGWDGLTLG